MFLYKTEGLCKLKGCQSGGILGVRIGVYSTWSRVMGPCATVKAVIGGFSLFFNYRICKERTNEMFNTVGSEKVC